MSLSQTTKSSHEMLCTQLVHFDSVPFSQKELQEMLENGDIETKTRAMENIIRMHLAYQPMPQLLMTIIRFVVPVQDHKLKKLVLYFWEIVDKTDEKGKLIDVMILVCSFLRNDLQHANEYIRGMTLRFLSKLKEHDLIEPLIPAVLENLEHRHAYVRRNAVLAVTAIYRRFPQLVPDAGDAVETFLQNEMDVSAKRNAFVFLFQHARPKAVAYLREIGDSVEPASSLSGDAFQLAVVGSLRELCVSDPANKATYLRVVFQMIRSSSAAVLFQCATTLIALGAQNPTCVRTAAQTYVQLLSSYGDHNVKLVLLDRLAAIRDEFSDIVSDLVLDLLRVLPTPNAEIHSKVLDLVLSVVNARNVEMVAKQLKRELACSSAGGATAADQSANVETRRQLIKAIHQSATAHHRVFADVVPVLLPILGESNKAAADVAAFFRDAAAIPAMRATVVASLLEALATIPCARAARAVLWIVGTHSHHSNEIREALAAVKAALGALPIEAPSTPLPAPEDRPAATTATTVRADGTYVTTTTMATTGPVESAVPSLRGLLLQGDAFLAGAIAAALAKLAVAFDAATSPTTEQKAAFAAECEALCGALREYLLSRAAGGVAPDSDAVERVETCIAVIAHRAMPIVRYHVADSLDAFRALSASETLYRHSHGGEAAGAAAAKRNVIYEPVVFAQLSGGAPPVAAGLPTSHAEAPTAIAFGREALELAAVVGDDGTNSGGPDGLLSSQNLSRVRQLTGLGEPVYAEVVLTVYQFDVRLSFLLANNTDRTLQNVTLELATVGDTLRICERLPTFTLAPKQVVTPSVSMKVAATEAGVIYGFITFDAKGGVQTVNLADVHIDVVEFIAPAYCTPSAFRSMWADFLWVNSIVVNSAISSLREFLDNVVRITNLQCLTASDQLDGDCDFLSANLYGRSRFGEDALVNVSIVKTPAGRIEGFVHIRARTQGVALAVGEKVNSTQKLTVAIEHHAQSAIA